MVASRPTEKELKTIEKLIRQQIGKGKPNLCLSVYKNRGGIYNQVKVWLAIDYDTMRTEDLFVTDYDYNKVDMIKTYTCVDEDKVVVKTNKEDIKKIMMARQRMAMIEAEIQEEEEEEEEEEKDIEEVESEQVSDDVSDEMSDETNGEEFQEDIKEEITPEEKPQEEPSPEQLSEQLPEPIPEPIQDKTEDPDFEFKVNKRMIPVDRSKVIIKSKSENLIKSRV